MFQSTTRNGPVAAPDSPPAYSTQQPALSSENNASTPRSYDTQTPVVVVDDTTSTMLARQSRQHIPTTLPYIDDGGLPEVVMPDDKIDIVPDCDPRKIREQEQQPKLPPRNSITKGGSVSSAPSRTCSMSSATVTPLGLLSDQPDMVDCPFCQRRSMTRVKKKASMTTQ